MATTVHFVEREIEINVDLSLLSWGDLLSIQKAQSGTVTEEQAETLLNTVLSKVTGQDVTSLPAVAVAEVLRQVMAQVSGAGSAQKN